LLVVSVDPNALGYSTAQFSRLYHELLTRVAAMPGVTAVGLSDLSPFGSGSRQRSISLRRPLVASLDDYNPHVMDVTADYFRAVGLPLVAGRTFDAAEVNAAAQVIVVNDSFARYYFGERAGAALGQRLSFGGGNPRDDLEIIGIVGDTKYLSLREERAPHLLYVPFAPDAFPIRSFSYSNATLAIRVTGAAADTVAPAVRQQIAAIDPRLPVLSMMTMEEQVRRTLGQERLLSAVSGAFAGLALIVATIGLYGLLSYGVARRRAEMAVRLALGARPADIRGLVLRDATATVAIGVAIGCGLAWLCGGVLGGLLYGVPANSPILMAGAALVLAATAGLAAWMPARSAARVPPATALRGE
jgi:predicted permease